MDPMRRWPLRVWGTPTQPLDAQLRSERESLVELPQWLTVGAGCMAAQVLARAQLKDWTAAGKPIGNTALIRQLLLRIVGRRRRLFGSSVSLWRHCKAVT